MWFINPNPVDPIMSFSLDSHTFQVSLYALLENLASKSVIWGFLDPIIQHSSENSSLIFKGKGKKFIMGKGMNESSLKFLLHVTHIIMSYFFFLEKQKRTKEYCLQKVTP